jgi:hypothetical protein
MVKPPLCMSELIAVDVITAYQILTGEMVG